MPEWHAPLDPKCPIVLSYQRSFVDDPMTKAAGVPVDDIMRAFASRHRVYCKRCQEYGAANIEVR